jgi:hypothetical protein
MTDVVETIGFADLPTLTRAAVKRCNTDLLSIARAVFQIHGNAIVFSLEDSDSDCGWQPAVWLSLRWNGQPCVVGVSESWSESTTNRLVSLSLDQLGEAGLDLLGVTRFAEAIPAGLNLTVVSVGRALKPDVLSSMKELGTWRGRDAATRELSGHVLRLWADEDFALQGLLCALAKQASYLEPSRLATMPISLALIAAKWHVNADILTDLNVGDVLIVS